MMTKYAIEVNWYEPMPVEVKFSVKDLLLRVYIVVQTLNFENSRCRLVNYVRELF